MDDCCDSTEDKKTPNLGSPNEKDREFFETEDDTIKNDISYDSNNNNFGCATGGESEGQDSGAYDGSVAQGFTKGKSQSMDELLTELDKIFFEHLHRIPGLIKGWGKSSDCSTAEVRIAKEASEKVKAFLDEYLGTSQGVAIIEIGGSNEFLGTGRFLSNSYLTPVKVTHQVGRGSVAMMLDPPEAGTLDARKPLSQFTNNPYGTLTCFMQDDETQKYYGIAPAHVLLEKALGNHEWSRTKCPKVVASDYQELNMSDWRAVRMSESYSAGMEYFKQDANSTKKFLDVGIFEVNDDLIASGVIKLGLGNYYQGTPIIFQKQSAQLMAKNVVKVGVETGVTTGVVKAVDDRMVFAGSAGKEIIVTGGITISSCPDPNSGQMDEFARNGDSGSPVFLEIDDKNTVVGYVCGGNFEEVNLPGGTKGKRFKDIYCIRMDVAKEYIETMTGMKLSLATEKGPAKSQKPNNNSSVDNQRILVYEHPGKKPSDSGDGDTNAQMEEDNLVTRDQSQRTSHAEKDEFLEIAPQEIKKELVTQIIPERDTVDILEEHREARRQARKTLSYLPRPSTFSNGGKTVGN